MISTELNRTKMLYGEAINTLKTKRIAVFGLGGVGGHTVEALARSGIGAIDLFDNDIIRPSNLNRQIVATRQTIGMLKVEAMANRIAEINPEITVNAHPLFYKPENADRIDLTQYDYVVDAVDTVAAKLELARRCYQLNRPIISSMGAGNKISPALLEVSDIYATSVCPLARVMRRELKKLGVRSLKVVYSKEEPKTPDSSFLIDELSLSEAHKSPPRRQTPGSNAFVPAVAGLIMASEIINDLTKVKAQN